MNRKPGTRLAFWIGCALLAMAGLGATPGNAIWLHMTDQNHNNLGYVISQRVRQPGVVSGSAFCVPG